MRLTAATGLVLALLIDLQAIADPIYQWRDADGRLHFSDSPPAAVDSPVTLAGQTRTDRHTPPSNRPAPRPSSRAQVTERQSRSHEKPPAWLENIRRRRELCAENQAALRSLREQMRRGYSVREAGRLEERERQYKDNIHHYCGA